MKPGTRVVDIGPPIKDRCDPRCIWVQNYGVGVVLEWKVGGYDLANVEFREGFVTTVSIDRLVKVPKQDSGRSPEGVGEMSKTLGQINYERFTPEWVTPLVPWHEVPVQEQRRWEAAAQAVWRYVVLNEKCIHAPKREAVIEAARAHKKREDTEQACPYDTWTTDWDIYCAIEALDKAEAGDESA